MDTKHLDLDNEYQQLLSDQYTAFYHLEPGEPWREITADLLNSKLVDPSQKLNIEQNRRRVIVFKYPSDNYKIKGVVNFVTPPENQPLLVYLRGGNRAFSIPNPASDLMCMGKYTVLSTLYRGGLSEGTDEYGGNDVNDVDYLVRFIPELQASIGVNFKPSKMFLLGSSRGGMQMFLALKRFPDLQKLFSKAVSLSGLLDIRASLIHRPDIKQMLIDDFGLKIGVNEQDWLDARDPLLAVSHISLLLPILLIQGTNDIRAGLEQGAHMLAKLSAKGHDVSYLEIEGGTHNIANIKHRAQLIMDWLEKSENF